MSVISFRGFVAGIIHEWRRGITDNFTMPGVIGRDDYDDLADLLFSRLGTKNIAVKGSNHMLDKLEDLLSLVNEKKSYEAKLAAINTQIDDLMGAGELEIGEGLKIVRGKSKKHKPQQAAAPRAISLASKTKAPDEVRVSDVIEELAKKSGKYFQLDDLMPAMLDRGFTKQQISTAFSGMLRWHRLKPEGDGLFSLVEIKTVAVSA